MSLCFLLSLRQGLTDGFTAPSAGPTAEVPSPAWWAVRTAVLAAFGESVSCPFISVKSQPVPDSAFLRPVPHGLPSGGSLNTESRNRALLPRNRTFVVCLQKSKPNVEWGSCGLLHLRTNSRIFPFHPRSAPHLLSSSPWGRELFCTRLGPPFHCRRALPGALSSGIRHGGGGGERSKGQEAGCPCSPGTRAPPVPGSGAPGMGLHFSEAGGGGGTY